MSLADLWFGLFVVIIAGYLILDGFDMGVGILHLIAARTDEERRLSLNSIGPVWDGNEVWIILGGGVLFAAFPMVYASLFSGFYMAFMLVLLVMILRTVAIEFRSKRPSARWRQGWDIVFSASSLGCSLRCSYRTSQSVSTTRLMSASLFKRSATACGVNRMSEYEQMNGSSIRSSACISDSRTPLLSQPALCRNVNCGYAACTLPI